MKEKHDKNLVAERAGIQNQLDIDTPLCVDGGRGGMYHPVFDGEAHYQNSGGL